MNPEYHRARFRCVAAREDLPGSLAVVTACNPGDAGWSDERNQEADRALAAEVDAAGLRRWRITGGSPDFRHREPGWGIDCDSRGAARAWGRRHGQSAVYWIEGDRLHLLEATAEVEFDLGSWSVRTEFRSPPPAGGWIQDR